MRLFSICLISSIIVLSVGCSDGSAPSSEGADPSEHLPGGETTNRFLLGSNAYIKQSATLDDENESAFFTGNSFFNQAWVQSPASTTTRDGLGPLFNSRSCSGCHFKDGRGRPSLDPSKPHDGFLVRLSVPGTNDNGGPLPDPNYGGQIQDHAVQGISPEARVLVTYVEVAGTYDDGQPYTLQKPTYTIDQLSNGPLADDIMMSPRVAPAMIGLGLLEAIPLSRLEALSDPDDANGDGIAGRINMVWDVSSRSLRPGRFGWKAGQPSVRQQVAGAFLGDIGITSELFPSSSCTSSQVDCLDVPNGGEPELQPHLLDRVVVYSQAVAPPVRTRANNANVLRGKKLFASANCGSCHVPKHTTGDHEIEALSNQTIWPYTDLLLHDMGPGLSDNRPIYLATGAHWRTPPLWGLSYLKVVNGHMQLLHDGRANGVEEAILWHGGEAEDSKNVFKSFTAAQRQDLVDFVESL